MRPTTDYIRHAARAAPRQTEDITKVTYHCQPTVERRGTVSPYCGASLPTFPHRRDSVSITPQLDLGTPWPTP